MSNIKFYAPVDFDDTSSGVTIDGDLIVDTNTFFVDVSTDRVGIGTASPYSYTNYNHLTIDGLSGAGYMLRNNGANKYEHYVDSSGAVFLLIDNDPLKFFTSSTERLRITGAGNILIGTTTDSGFKLNVSGSSHLNGETRLGNFTGSDADEWPKVYWYRDAVNNWDEGLIKASSSRGFFGKSHYGIHFDNDRAFGFFTSNWTKVLGLKSDQVSSEVDVVVAGNVGIGTTSPAKKLDVNGVIRISNGGSDKKIEFLRTGGKTFSIEQDTSRLYFYNSTDGISSLAIRNNGNVGIGTQSPDYKLHVSHSDSNNGLLLQHASQASGYQILQNIRQNEGLIWQRHVGGLFNANLMTLSYDGNVGIGTTSPSKKLDIVASDSDGVKVSGGTNGRYVEVTSTNLDFYTTSTSGYGMANTVRKNSDGSVLGHISGAFGSVDTLTYTYYGGTAYNNAAMYILSSNKNVGIATATPSYKLHVNGSMYVAQSGVGQTILLGRSNGQPTIKADSSNGGHLILDSLNNFLSLNHYVSQNVVANSGGGNFLIGTTTDSGYKLDVAGTARFSDNVTISSSGAPKDLTIYGNSAGEFMQYDGSASTLNIYGKSNSPALGVFVNGGASPTDIQFKVGRDVSQYYGIKVEDRTAFLVHRQDETDVGVHQVYNEIWTSGSGDHNWAWRIANNTGGSASEKMKLTKDSVLTLGGGSNTITNTKVGQWDTAYSWGDHSTQSYATQSYVNTQVSNLVDSAPSTLDTLNELAAALGDDPNFATTVTNSIATKLPLAGGTLTGDLTLDNNQLKFGNGNVSAPSSSNQDAGTRINLFPQANHYSIGVESGNMWFNSDGGYKWYNDANNIASLSLSGVFYVNGGNSGQWNTAYGWGDHASAGYASASSLSNYLPLTGGTLTGSLAGTNITATNFYGQNLYVTSSGNTVANRIDNDGSGLYFTYGGASNKGIYLKDSNGYVGIGTTIPANKLTVVGTGAIAALRSTAAVGQNYLDFVNSSGTPKGYVGYGASSSDTLYLTQLVSGADIAFYNSGVRMTVKSSGNVGIGTTSPAHKLNVSSSNNTTALGIDFPSANYDFSANSTSGYTTLFHMNNTGLDIGHNSSSRALNLKTNSTDRLTITGGGNVGIGTTSPTKKLHVEGTTKITGDTTLGTTSSAFLQMIRAGANYIAASDVSGELRFRTGGSSDRLTITSSGNVGIGTTSPDSVLDIKASGDGQIFTVKNSSGNNILRLYNDDDDGGTFRLLDSGGNIQVQFSSEGSGATFNYILSSNVGIGTTSPGAKLHINGTYFQDAPASGTGTHLGSSIRYGSDTNYRLDYKQIVSSGLVKHSYTVVNNGTGYDNNLVLDRGNVGIGTSSPAQKLHVSGRTRVDQNSQAFDLVGTDHVYSAWYPRGTSNGRKAYMGYAGASTTDFTAMNQDTGAFIIGTNNAERMRIISAGNVGIGTTSPLNTLVVRGPSSDGSAGSGNVAQFEGPSGTNGFQVIVNDTANASGIQTKNADAFLLNPNGGNVGIGTTSPTYKLDVDGTGRFKGNVDIYKSNAKLTVESTGASEQASVDVKNTSLHARWILDADDLFRVYNQTSSFDAFAIKSSGNVGIGTTSPVATLEVEAASTVNGTELAISNDYGESRKFITFRNGSDIIGQISTYGRHSTAGAGPAMIFDLSNGTSAVERLRITKDGNVGIGTQSPSKLLTVGSGSTSSGIVNNGIYVAVDGGAAVTARNTTNQVEVQLNAEISQGTLGTFTNHPLAFRTNNTNRMYITSAGNVGIGTTSPSYKLDVGGGNFFVNGSNRDWGGSAGLGTHIGTGDFDIYSGAPGSGVHKLKVTNAGRVGIGTTSPSATLTVVGNQLFDGTGINLKRTGVLSERTWNFGVDSNGLSIYDVTSSAYRLIIGSSGNVLIGTTTDAGHKLNVNGEINSTGIVISGQLILDISSVYTRLRNPEGTIALYLGDSGDRTNYYDNNAHRFRGAGGSGDKMFINSSGNVGIGTTNPSNLLHIQSASSGFSGTYDSRYKSIVEANGEAYYATYVPDNSFSGIRFNNTSGLRGFIDYYHGTQGDALVYSAANHHRFLTNGVEKVRLIQNGNVGIGTTSPSTKLHILQSGTAVSSDGVSSLVVQKSAAAATAAAINIVSGDSAEASLRFGDTTDQSMGALRYLNDADAFSIVTNNNEQVRITSGGNLGIGTSSPNHLLDVESTGASARIYNLTSNGNTDVYLTTTGTTGASRLLFGDDADNDIGKIIYRNNGDSMAFETNAAEAMRITSAGNLGIGTTNPTQKLDVNGTARAVKSKIDFTPTSDTIALDIRGTGTPNDYFTVSNATGGANDVFLPIFFYKAATYGYNGGTNRYPSGVYGGGFVAAVDDTSYPSAAGAGAAMHFNARTYANNGPLTNRYLFSWGSWLTTHMAMTAGGNLLIGTTTDSGEKLQVNGDADISGDINADGDFYQNGTQGWSGTINIPTNPPVTITVQGGIITNVT